MDYSLLIPSDKFAEHLIHQYLKLENKYQNGCSTVAIELCFLGILIKSNIPNIKNKL